MTTPEMLRLELEATLLSARQLQKDTDRSDPKTRHLALVVTKLEEAEMWLKREVQ